MSLPPGDVVIAIPTFRRPYLLARLLESLQPEAAGRAVEVLVCDNDCDARIETLVATWRRRGLPVHYAPVTQRGLAAVRNALVAAARDLSPAWRWLAMLDDDGYVPEGWLARIVGCADAHGRRTWSAGQ